MRIVTAAAPPFFKNGYVISCERTRAGVVIDPGDEVDELLDRVHQDRLDIQAILLTHAHFDHVTGVGRAKASLRCPGGLHGRPFSL